ncbi:MAG: hypothetical protein Q4B64_07475 [Spirochaetales bacterium]|nr:hypothetical protein [Spirochaetales bacterium]
MKKMTTFLGGALIAAALLLSGCQNFLTANADAREKLQAEIKYAKAETVSFTIAPVSSEDGQVTSKATSAKIGFPVAIEFEVNQKVGSFVRWDVYSNYKGDGSDVALTDAVKFEREDARKTEMTIMSAVPNLRIIPRVSANPKVRLVTAKNELLQSMGSITPSGTQAWNPDNTHDISAESENGYAIKGWKVYKKSGETDVPVTSVKATDGDGNDLTRKYFGFDAPENPDIEFLSINLSETQKKSTATIKFSGSDIEGLYFEPVYAERPTLQHCFDYLENDRILSSQSFVFEMNHPFNITEIKNSIYVEVISGGTKNKGDFSVSESGNNFTVKLEGNIPANSPVTLLMYNTLKDSNGITVGGETRAYKFTTTADGTPPVLSGPDTRLYYKGNTTDYVTYATFRETSLSTIKNHSQDTYSYSTTKTQFRFYISATDVGGSLAQYEIVERIKYLPANMIIPKNREIKEGVTYGPEEYDYIANGTLVFDNDDKLQSPFENEDFYKKTWTIAANNSTSQSINHYFSTKIPIGGIHEFSVTAIDAHGNRSKTLRMYIRFINKRFDFELPTTYGTDKVSQMSTLSMTASPTGFDDDGGMGSVFCS